MAITYQNGSKPVKKKNRTGLVIGCCAAFAGVIVLVALGIWTYTNSGFKSDKFESPEAVASAFVERFYAGDAEGIFSMQPKDMQARSQQDAEMTYAIEEGNLESAITEQRKAMDAYLESVHAAHGDNWKADFKFGKYQEFSDEEKDALQLSYRMMGVSDDFKLNDAGYVQVTATLSGDSGSTPCDVVHYVPVIKIDNDWYIGQEYGEEYAALVGEAPSMVGDLLDGYHIVGEFDQNGERVYRTPEGRQLLKDDKGDYYYEDDYGNKHYCEYNVLDIYGQCKITKETRVEGPDGGEALTADTYEEYWASYYDKLAEEHGEMHDEDVHGSVSGNELE